VREIGLRLPAPGTAEDGTVTAGGLSERFVNAGRFLLFEFIRENKHQISVNDKVWPYVQSAFFRQVVSWCNREAFQRHEVLAKLPRLSNKWQTGAVSLFDDWRRYADLASDLLCSLAACSVESGGVRWRTRSGASGEAHYTRGNGTSSFRTLIATYSQRVAWREASKAMAWRSLSMAGSPKRKSMSGRSRCGLPRM
jgi:hypothetical protein